MEKKWPLYQFTQFLLPNFKRELQANAQQGVHEIQDQNYKMRRLMAIPDFYHWFQTYHKTYTLFGKQVDWQTAYSFERRLVNTVSVRVDPNAHQPYGVVGGNIVVAPSWAVWNRMSILFHEVQNATKGINGDDPVLTGVLAGEMQTWCDMNKWNYSTIDVNTLKVTAAQLP